MKRKIFLPVFLSLAILTVGILATKVKAEEVGSYPPIVQKIAERFNLNVSDVKQVFDEERDERRADRYARFTERLNDLVSEGKLTEDQKDAVLAKHEEMQNQIEELRNLSFEERKTKMQEVHDDFKSWAEGQGIDLSTIGPLGGPFGRGMGHGMGMGKWIER